MSVKSKVKILQNFVAFSEYINCKEESLLRIQSYAQYSHKKLLILDDQFVCIASDLLLDANYNIRQKRPTQFQFFFIIIFLLNEENAYTDGF